MVGERDFYARRLVYSFFKNKYSASTSYRSVTMLALGVKLERDLVPASLGLAF